MRVIKKKPLISYDKKLKSIIINGEALFDYINKCENELGIKDNELYYRVYNDYKKYKSFYNFNKGELLLIARAYGLIVECKRSSNDMDLCKYPFNQIQEGFTFIPNQTTVMEEILKKIDKIYSWDNTVNPLEKETVKKLPYYHYYMEWQENCKNPKRWVQNVLGFVAKCIISLHPDWEDKVINILNEGPENPTEIYRINFIKASYYRFKFSLLKLIYILR